MTDPRPSKSEVLSDLRRRILTEDLSPGSHLDETEIADRYGLSRPPLRELLRQLAGEGYVAIEDNKGARVSPMSMKSLRDFFVVAPMIYAAVARLAAQNARPAQIMRLKDTQLLFRRALRGGTAAERALLNERFHALMGEMADNVFLMPSLRRLLIDHARISMTFYDPRASAMAASREIAADQHDQFIALIDRGDADAAEALAIAHWDLSRNDIETFVSPPALDLPLGQGLKARG